MNIPYVMRKCTGCGRWLVASTDNYSKLKSGKYGLKSRCKKCESEYNKRYNKQYYENNKEKERERKKQYHEANRKKDIERCKRWRETNKEKIAEYNEVNKDKIVERRKRYYKNNKDKIAEQRKLYHQSPQGQVAIFNGCQRRRIKEEQQGAGITTDQWLEIMNFFDWKCAYSGDTLTKDNRSIDHIVPLDAGGDNMIWNMVPMKLNYNSSKRAKDMLEWYKEQSFYDPKRLAKIYEWQEYARKKWEN